MFSKIINKHTFFPLNTLGRDFFVGDIHGYYDLFIDELTRHDFDYSVDRCFAVGDLVNYGAQSTRCVELLLKDWFKATLGNHEELLLSFVNDKSMIDTLLKVGGGWVLDLYKSEPSKLKYLLAIIYAKMPCALTVDTCYGQIGVIHAQAPDDWQQAIDGKLDLAEAFWSMEKYKRPGGNVANIDLVVSGHVNCTDMTVAGNQVWIDTIKKSGKLSVLTAKELFEKVGK